MAAMDKVKFFRDLMTLKDAIDKVQPLADIRGNFHAIHALVELENALKPVNEYMAQAWDASDAR